MNYIISADTDIGNTKNVNQDSYNVRVYSSEGKKVVFAILCDGMGGYSKGELASASVVNAFVKWTENNLSYIFNKIELDDVIIHDWNAIINEYNYKIKTHGDQLGIKLGTTLTAMLLTDNKYYIANVGDTRAYEMIHNAHVITRDQSVVAKEVELGHITPEQAEHDPRRSVLLQCIGASAKVKPDFYINEIKKNAVYMLCTDGFRHEISAEEIFTNLCPERMLNEFDMKAQIRALIDLDKSRQETDNITAICVRTF